MLNFLFFTFAKCLKGNYTLDDVAFGIWTGKDMVKSRVLGMAETYFKFLPQIDVYSDFINESELLEIINTSNHLNITFHSIPTIAHHLIGTTYNDKWNRAQSRHLVAFDNLYKRYPNKKWYFLGDDDTFLFPDSIPNLLNEYDYKEKAILGHIYKGIDFLSMYYPSNKMINFAQGGGGLFISKALMDFVGPYILNCTQFYEVPYFVSDMRLSSCIAFVNSINNIEYNSSLYFVNKMDVMHGYRPEESPHKNDYSEMPVTFHHIVPPYTYWLWNSSYSRWNDKDGTEVYVEWAHIATSDIIVEIGRRNNFMEFYWGYLLRSNICNETFNSLTQIEPVFEEGESIPSSYVQKYDGNITIRYICDDSIERGEMVFDSFLGGDEEGSSFLVKCLKPKKYRNTFIDGSKYTYIHEEQSPL